MQLVGFEFCAGAETAVHHGKTKASIAKIRTAALQCRVLATPPQLSRVLRRIMARRMVTVRWIASLISG